MLERVLAEDIDAFFGRKPRRVCRPEDRLPERPRPAAEIGIGTWSVTVKPPRVSDLPPGKEPFSLAPLPKRRYLSEETQGRAGGHRTAATGEVADALGRPPPDLYFPGHESHHVPRRQEHGRARGRAAGRTAAALDRQRRAPPGPPHPRAPPSPRPGAPAPAPARPRHPPGP